MFSIAIDTCFHACSASVRRNGADVARRYSEIGRGHADCLIAMVQDVARSEDVDWSKLTEIIVTAGPGTFTGQRVGIACAQGLMLASGAEAWTATSLQAIAATARRVQALETGADIAVVVSAGRGDVYWQLLRGDCVPRSGPERLSARDLIARAKGFRGVFVGSEADRLYDITGRQPATSGEPARTNWADARDLHDLAANRCLVRATSLRPQYLRPPDAEPNRDILPRQ
ncbi:MAG: tRNA (adenosine(37)-N6)-threonylcarbamoyltransferase complex dimerization subunit type 1 TsaB [Pseudomonadota bacterium]